VEGENLNKITSKKIDAKEYINKLKLVAPIIPNMGSVLRSYSFILNSGKSEGFVVGDSLYFFEKGMPKQMKWDVLDSVLLAQLHANHEYSRFNQPIDWYKCYVEVLNNIGWAIQDFNFDELKSSDDLDTTKDVILNVLKAICTPDEISFASSVLDALKTDNDAFAIWNQNSNSNNKGNFKLGTAFVEDKVPVLKMSAFYLTATQIDSRFLWSKWSDIHGNLFISTQAANLNEDTFAHIRADVKEKVVDVKNAYIRPLNIKSKT